MARIKEFGELGIVGDGDSIEEALQDLEKTRRDRFMWYKRNNTSGPYEVLWKGLEQG